MSEEKRDDGGPAFPVSDQGIHGNYGMSLRDWFAGQALTGMVNKPRQNPEFYAAEAYCIADAMLEARKR